MSTDETKGAVFVRKLEGLGFCNRTHYLAFYPTTTNPCHLYLAPGYSVLKDFDPAVASGMSHDRCTIAEDLLVSVFVFIESLAPNFRTCMNARPHLVPRLQDGAWTDVQYA